MIIITAVLIRISVIIIIMLKIAIIQRMMIIQRKIIPALHLPSIHSGLVIIESRDGNIGNFNPLATCSKLLSKFEGLSYFVRNRIKATFSTCTAANSFLLKVNNKPSLKAFIPNSILYRFGAIRDVLTDIPTQDLHRMEQKSSAVKVVDIRRIHRRQDSSLIPTRTVEIKILVNSLPEFISIHKLRFEVQPSINPPPLFVSKLFPIFACCCPISTQVYQLCGGNHVFSSCSQPKSEMPSRLNCNNAHFTTDRVCPYYQEQYKRSIRQSRLR